MEMAKVIINFKDATQAINVNIYRLDKVKCYSISRNEFLHSEVQGSCNEVICYQG